MTLLYLFGCCYGFPKSKRIFFPHIVPTTDILCGGFFPFSVDLCECLWAQYALVKLEIWGFKVSRSSTLIWSLIWPLREDVRRLEDTVFSPEARSRALKPEFSFAHPTGLVDHCAGPGFCGRFRTRGESPPHSPLPRKQASPYCAYRYPQNAGISKSRAQ